MFQRRNSFGVGEWQRFIHTRGPTPPPCSNHAASCVFGNKLFIFGGIVKGPKVTNTLYKFSLDISSWDEEEEVQLASDVCPPGRSYCCLAGCTERQSLFLFGGDLSSGEF